MASMDSMSSFHMISELVYPLWTDLLMFGLALLVYVLFTGPLRKPPSPKKTPPSPKSSPPVAKKSATPPIKAAQPPALPIRRPAPSYAHCLKLAGQEGDRAELWRLWEEVEEKAALNPVILGCMVEGLCLCRLPEEAWKLCNKTWQSQPSCLNAIVYGSLVKGFTVAKQFQRAIEILAEMQERSITASILTYNMLLNSLVSSSQLKKALALFETMQQASVKPNAITYSTILKGYCTAGNMDGALKLFTEMKADGDVKPDEITYNGLLSGCAKKDRLEDAMKLLREMEEAGIPPSNFTLSIVIKLLGKNGRLSEAFALLDNVTKSEGFKPNVQTCTSLLSACFLNRQGHRAMAFYEEMMREGYCQPDARTYSVMVSGWMKSANLERAAEVLRCAYGMPGHDMRMAKQASGVEESCMRTVEADARRRCSPLSRFLQDLAGR